MADTGTNVGIRHTYSLGFNGWRNTFQKDLRGLDTLVQARVLDKDLNAPPGSPVDGAAYIVGPSPTGAWAGKANQIARRDGDAGTWEFWVPLNGWTVWIEDELNEYRFNGTSWAMVAGLGNGDVNLLDRIPANLHAAIRSYSSTTDVASYVQQAIDDAWARGVGVYVPGGRYYIRSTINIKCGRFYSSTFPQSATGVAGHSGAQFRFDPPAGWADLTAAFHCSHVNGVVEGIEVFGGATFAIASMASWCNPALLPSYTAFSAGLAGFRVVDSAKTVFRRIKASGKVGLLIDSEDGHISVYDSTLSGMFGVYQRIASGDMFFQGCGINGSFAGIIFGDLLYAGHYGGFQGCLFRCHMGFSPWGIYQVRDNGTDTSGLSSVSGWAGSLIEVSWEQVGECAMELLPNSASDINIVGGTQGWASIASFRVPTAIRSERMKYWFRLGQVEFFSSTWALQSSGREFYIPSPYADNLSTAKAAYIHKLGVRSIRCNWDTLGGSVDIGPGGVDRQTGNPIYFRGFRRVKEEDLQAAEQVNTTPNLILSPETAGNWTLNGDAGAGATREARPWSLWPELAAYPIPVQMREELGPDPVVVKFVAGTGAGTDCGATINIAPGVNLVGARKFFSYWGICPGATLRNIRSSLIDASDVRIMDAGRGTGLTTWDKHEAYDGSPSHASTKFGIGFHNSASQPTYVAGVMVSVGRLRPYCPKSTLDISVDRLLVGGVEVVSAARAGFLTDLTVSGLGGSGNRMVVAGPSGLAAAQEPNTARTTIAAGAHFSSVAALLSSGYTGGRASVMTAFGSEAWEYRSNRWLPADCPARDKQRFDAHPTAITWTARTSAQDNNWQSVIYIPCRDRFVAVSSDGTNRVMVSDNGGVSWSTRSAAAALQWKALVYLPSRDRIVAVASSGTGNRVMVSDDGGDTWTTRTSAADLAWRALAYSASRDRIVAVAELGGASSVMTSDDGGTTWTSRTAINGGWHSVVYIPSRDRFVAIAYSSGGAARCMTSDDGGVTWTSRTVPDRSWLSLCYIPSRDRLVAVSSSGTGDRVMTSDDGGTTWTQRASAADNQWLQVCYIPSRDRVVAVANTGTGNRVMTSDDGGVTWVTRTSPADNNWVALCYANGRDVLVAVAQSGTGNRAMTSGGFFDEDPLPIPQGTVVGSIASGDGSPRLRFKKLTGTTAGTQGGSANIAHGVLQAKILGAEFFVEAGGEKVPPSCKYIPGIEYDVTVGAASLTIKTSAANSASILNCPITVLLTYEV